MSRYWNPLLQRLSPYTPGEQPTEKLVKLNTNECPYGPSPAVRKAIAEAAGDDLRLYPDPESVELRRVWGAAHGLEPESVFVGNGSDEVLAHTMVALLKQDAAVLFPDISYSFYPVYCRLFEVDWREVPLREDFSLEPADYAGQCGGVIFPNPNAPTGLAMPLSKVREILELQRDVVVVVDEAYIDFGAESATSLLPDYDNLLVIQTLSKSRALAGLRVGAAFGSAPLIEGLSRVKNSFNSYPLGRTAQAGAIAALQDQDWFDSLCRRTIESRDAMVGEMAKLGFEVLPSSANFVFARHGERAAGDLFAALREKGILVRHFSAPRIDNWLRISVGTPEQCEMLLAALGEILA